MKVRMICAKSTQRFMRQVDPQTKQEVKGLVYDVDLVIATADGQIGVPGKPHPDNKDAFVGSHTAALTLQACSMPFTVLKEYVIEISEVQAVTPAGS